jgi:hypothetical protein
VNGELIKVDGGWRGETGWRIGWIEVDRGLIEVDGRWRGETE